MTDWQITVLFGMVGGITYLVFDTNSKIAKIFNAMKNKGEIE